MICRHRACRRGIGQRYRHDPGVAARRKVFGARIAAGFRKRGANNLRPSMAICVFRHRLLPASVASSQLGYRSITARAQQRAAITGASERPSLTGDTPWATSNREVPTS
jgi:hypothetical protein